MFVQVIQGRISDAGEMRTALDQWLHEVQPGAIGWLGSTGGVTDDGQFIAVARFESEEAARRNSERREQDAWWTRTSKLFTQEPKFLDSTHVVVDIVGDPDKAGFVQVMQGRGTDAERARELMGTEDSDAWAAFRPEILGSLAIEHDGGAYTMVLYFTSEEDAREGERKEMPPELKEKMDELNSLNVGEPAFYDLKQPWLHSPS